MAKKDEDVKTREKCSHEIHYCLEDADEKNIWAELGVKRPTYVPYELRSPTKQNDYSEMHR